MTQSIWFGLQHSRDHFRSAPQYICSIGENILNKPILPLLLVLVLRLFIIGTTARIAIGLHRSKLKTADRALQISVLLQQLDANVQPRGLAEVLAYVASSTGQASPNAAYCFTIASCFRKFSSKKKCRSSLVHMSSGT